jgi:hypothetical protein
MPAPGGGAAAYRRQCPHRLIPRFFTIYFPNGQMSVARLQYKAEKGVWLLK